MSSEQYYLTVDRVYSGRDMAVAKAALVAPLLFGRRCAYITSLRENTYKIVEPLMRLLQLPCPYHCTAVLLSHREENLFI